MSDVSVGDVKLSERCRNASHGVRGGDGPASGIQSRPRLRYKRESLLSTAQRLSGELSDMLERVAPSALSSCGLMNDAVAFSLQAQVLQIKLHQVRRIYKRRHGLRPLVGATTPVRCINTIFTRTCLFSLAGARSVLFRERLLLRHLSQVLQRGGPR